MNFRVKEPERRIELKLYSKLWEEFGLQFFRKDYKVTEQFRM